jgi:hypothetical protein
MIDRRRFLAISLAAAVVPIGAPLAQTTTGGKLPRVAYVWLFNVGPSAPYQPAFRPRVAELGWIENKTFIAE